MFALLFVWPDTLLGQSIPESAMYLNQKLPGLVSTLFAPNLISSKSHYDYGSTLSKDGTEFYYAVIIDGKPQIRWSRFAGNAWTAPQIVIASNSYEYNDPFLSADEKLLYFISDQAQDRKGEKKDFDIWYLERQKDGWSETPINAGPAINTKKNEYYMSFTEADTMYFSSNGNTDQTTDHNYDILLSRFSAGVFEPSEKLIDAINTEHYEADVFVSPDEQYLIFCSERPGGLGKGDLYISFKDNNGKWQKAKNMGNLVNTEGYEFCPFVTGDGNNLFFYRDGDIFWISAAVVESLK